MITLALGAMATLGTFAPSAQAAQPTNALPNPAASFLLRGQASLPRIEIGSRPGVDVHMTIDQQSRRAVLNWRSFNIGSRASVHFNQLHGAVASTVNIIDDSNGASEIYGRLSAPGEIILINRNGFVFGVDPVSKQGAQVDVRRLIASALLPGSELQAFYDRYMDSGFGPDGNASIPVLQWNGDRAGFETTLIEIEHGATIKTASGGSVMLFAPKVKNAGTIETPDGQMVLAAGARVYLAFEGEAKLRGFLVEVDPYETTDVAGQPLRLGGEVTNEKLGRIIAERGNITMAAYTVNQRGAVRATTAVNRNGSIVLTAGDTPIFQDARRADGTIGQDSVPDTFSGRTRLGTLTLGDDSVTEVVPDDSKATIPRGDATTVFNPSTIELVGKVIHLQERSVVRATGGVVTAYTVAERGKLGGLADGATADDGLIYIASNALIDVSGTKEYAVPMESNFIEVKLLGNDLRDNPPQRNGFLYRQPVWIDIRRRPMVADFEGHIKQVGITVGELSTAGGTVNLKTEGALIVRENARIDISGGSVYYPDGYGRTTQLRDIGGRIFDIGDASASGTYATFGNSYTKENTKWNWAKTWTFGGGGNLPQAKFYEGYVDGRSGGRANFYGHSIVLDGSVEGRVTYSRLQRYYDSLPLQAALRIGNWETSKDIKDYKLPGILITRDGSPLPQSFTIDDALAPENPQSPDPWRHVVQLSSDKLSTGGVGNVELYSNEAITVASDAQLDLPVGGRLLLLGEHIRIDGGVNVPASSDVFTDSNVPASSIELRTVDTYPVNDSGDPVTAAQRHSIHIGAGARLSARGQWVNEFERAGFSPVSRVSIDGGSITIESGGHVISDTGSVIDVSGGGHVDSRARLKAGKGGSITISSGDIGVGTADTQQSGIGYFDGATFKSEIRTELLAYGIERGGTLKISTTKVRVGGEALDPSPSLELHLKDDFFQRGGFRSYSINGRDGLTVPGSARIHPLMRNLVLHQRYFLQPTGSDILRIADIVLQPAEKRAAASIALLAGTNSSLESKSPFHGRLLVERGAVINTDPGGAISLAAARQLTVDGALNAPAGTIALALAPDTLNYFPDRSIWLGSHARLNARGELRRQSNGLGLLLGEVLNGGRISVDASNGFIVTEQGSLMDVSGTSAELDIRHISGYRRQSIAGDAGSITLKSREGMMLDGEFAATPGGADARAGALSIAMTSENARYQNAPRGDRIVSVRDDGSSIPAGLTTGAAIGDPYNGKAYVTMDRVRRAGFDSLTLKGEDRIEFAESTSTTLRRSVVLDAPVVAAAPDAAVALNSGYFALTSNSNLTAENVPQSAAPGNATLDVSARMIDVKGHIGLDRFGAVRLNSASDIRLIGVPSALGDNLALLGSLSTAANLTLGARQIYPATMNQFLVRLINNPNAVLTTTSTGAPTPVLSAAGKLTVTAPTITHGGTFKAPFGQVILNAANRLTLDNGSVVSVSADGLDIPFGRTELEGRQYVYDIDGNNFEVIKSTPQKQVQLEAPVVTVNDNASVDLSGGGDLLGYEFAPGPPGRSVDSFASGELATSFAIMPTLHASYAPYDEMYYRGTAAMPGESVYLAGIPGQFGSGVYAKLPARYAILPGAFLVTPKSGYGDMAVQNFLLGAEGTIVAKGYNVSLTQTGQAQDARFSGFAVKPSERVRWETDYSPRRVSAYFADSGALQRPIDAGRLVIDAANALTFAGILKATPAQGGRGGEVDITATRLAVSPAGTPGIDNTFVRLDPTTMNRFTDASLMLGGTRRATAEGIEIDVRAEMVDIANDSQNSLSAPEVILVARDNVTVRDGAVVEGAIKPGRPPVSLNRADLILPAGDNGTPGDTADDTVQRAALIRVSAGDQVGVRRPGKFVDDVSGGASYEIQSGATLRASSSMILDDTGLSTIHANSTVEPGQALAIGAANIGLGQGVPTPAAGVILTGDNLSRAAQVNVLTLRSYKGIDVGTGLDVKVSNLTLEAAEIRGHGSAGTAVTINATGSITLGNPSGNSYRGGQSGGGDLLLSAQDRLMLKDGQTALRGFANTTMDVDRDVRLEGKGGLDVAGRLTIATPRLSAATGSDYRINAVDDSAATPTWYAVKIKRSQTIPADLPAINDLGARLGIFGRSVNFDTAMAMPSGRLELGAKGTDSVDTLSLGPNARIAVNGLIKRFADTVSYSPGGTVL
ncbi:MAG TPA: filamentous hemagglutinin N-terminal domain-containing protein, partial [Burkholderiales bacterium]|nr:filamentous hemagglutinin N-terminal domain-containing protein [Burkholderiales bacterium]